MASFIIHHIAGNRFLETLTVKYDIPISEENKKQFLLGNLIVDSVKMKLSLSAGLSNEEEKRIRDEFIKIVQKEKENTHFRDEMENELVIQSPKLEKFLLKYYNFIKNDFTALGYFFHLYTDKMFFVDLFRDTFECLDKDGKVTEYKKNAKFVKVKKNAQIYDVIDFFDHKYPYSLYHDYTMINRLLLDYYKLSFDCEELLSVTSNFFNPGIVEVDYSNIVGIIQKIDTFVNGSYELLDNDLNIFDERMIKNFIEVVVNKFILNYEYLFSEIRSKNEKARIRSK